MNKSEVVRPVEAGRQTFWRRPAADHLQPLITSFMARRDHDPRAGMIVFPNAQPEIFAHFGSPYWTSETIGGHMIPLPQMSLLTPRLAPYRHANGPDVDWFLMQLTPLGCRALLRTPMAALTGPDLALASIVGPSAHGLYEALAKARGFDDRCSIAEAWADGHGKSEDTPGLELSEIITAARRRAIRSVRQTALDLGISDRRLHQIFATHIGVSPKTFFSLMRAERLWTRAHPHSEATGLFGEFADQSHAAREFKRFTGMSLGAYVRAKNEGDSLVNGITAAQSLATPIADFDRD